jgi:hypothetical protein
MRRFDDRRAPTFAKIEVSVLINCHSANGFHVLREPEVPGKAVCVVPGVFTRARRARDIGSSNDDGVLMIARVDKIQ